MNLFKIPSWLHKILLVVLAIISALSPLVTSGQLQWLTPVWGVVTMIALIIHSVDPETAAKTLPAASLRRLADQATLAQSLLACFFLLIVGALLMGCISSAPIVPVTPENQAQISSCQNTATVHNGIVFGDFIVGGSTAAVAGVAAALPSTDVDAKTALAITAAVLGGLDIAGTAVASMTTANFTNSRCSDVVGALPARRMQ